MIEAQAVHSSSTQVRSKGRWPTVKVGDALNLINGRAFKPTEWTKTGTPIVRIQNLNNPDAPFNYYQGELPAKIALDDGDLLFAWSGTPGTSFGAHIWRGGKAWLNQHIFKVEFEASQFDKRFLQLAINQNLAEYIRAAHGGAGLAHITKGRFEGSEIPAPPLREQHEIVDEIEKQFTRLDAGVAALRRVQANLKRYRAAVLKAACEGRLVPTEAELARKEGRNFESGGALLAHILDERRSNWEGKGKFREPAPPSKSLNPLPAGWTWAHVEQLGDVQLGRQRSPKNVSKDYPTKYIRAANITEGGLDLSDVLEMEFSPAERERFSLRPGDVVLSEASGSPSQVGKPAIWRNELPLCCFQNTVLRLRPTAVDPKYVLVTFQCFYANGIFAKVAGGVGINHLGAEKFSAIPFPLPPLAEQARIVAEVERRLSVVQELEASVGTNLQRVARLRQSILRTAFSPGGRKGDLGGHALVAPSAP